MPTETDFTIDTHVDDHVAVVEYCRGEHNYFSQPLIDALADTLHSLAVARDARVVVLTGRGRHFCAGADLSGASTDDASEGARLYDAAVRLFEQPLPVIAAVRGAAIGGGLGLAMACDFRVTDPSARLAAPFSRLGLHHGFGLTVTLPHAIGHQRAIELLYTGRRISGTEAVRIGLCDALADDDHPVLETATTLAAEIASAAPLVVRSIRRTMRGHLADEVRRATAHERHEQLSHRRTEDFIEGVRADLERRSPVFQGA